MYWIECTLIGQCDTTQNTVKPILTFMSVIFRSKGEIIFYFGKKWRVTECYPA